MLDYILPFLIFVSLGVIIYIIGKHLPELKRITQNNSNKNNDKDEKSIESFKGVFYKGGVIIKNSFLFFIEFIIKKIKQFLHLVHFWVLKTRKGNSEGDELSRESEVKKELIASEEQSLESIIEDDLTKDVEVKIKKEVIVDNENKEVLAEEEVVVINEDNEKDEPDNVSRINKKEEVFSKEEDQVAEIDDEDSEKRSKIESFFSDFSGEDEKDEEFAEVDKKEDKEKKGFSLASAFSFLGGFRGKFKKQEKEEDEIFDEDDLYSDGVVGVTDSDSGINNVDESNLIKEVVPVAKKEVDIDDEIGVDRSILEKKIVQKIAKNPKDMENYRELGELYIKMKNFSDAEECYRQVLRVHLRDVDAKRKLEKIKLLKRMG